MSYTEWLRRLTAHFFGPEFGGSCVRLIVTRDVLDESMPDLGGTDGFVAAVQGGPEWPCRRTEWGFESPPSLQDRAIGLHDQWQRRRNRHPDYPGLPHDVPPYLPYLCLTCLAWGEELGGSSLPPARTRGGSKGVAGHAFFERLERLYPNHGLNTLAAWKPLWTGLANWTEIHGGELGRFTVECLGGMPHVGIPKAQVVLTARKIERLPELFRLCHLVPGDGREVVTREIEAHSAYSQAILGDRLLDEIQRQTKIGNVAIDRICEQLEDWDGYVPDRSEEWDAAPEGEGDQGLMFRLAVALEACQEEGGIRWQPRFAVLHDHLEPQVRLVHEGKEWTSVLQPDGRTALLCALDDGQASVPPIDLATCWREGWRAEGLWSDEAAGERRAVLRLRGSPLRVLQWADSNMLVEANDLPAETHAYVLVSDENQANWQHWLGEYGGELEVHDDLPQDGLPPGWHLVYIASTAPLTQDARDHWPDGGGRRPRPKLVRLQGGSRVKIGHSRRNVFLPFDPPDIHVEAAGDISWSAQGGTLTEVAKTDDGAFPWKYPTSAGCRVLRVDVDPNATVFTAEFIRDAQVIGRVAFGLQSDPQGIHVSTEQCGKVDACGSAVSPGAAGVCGAVVPESQHPPWEFLDGPAQHGADFTTEMLDRACFRFLESLSVAGSRLTYREVRRRAAAIGGLEVKQLSRETRWLCNLGHIEVESDSRGRWAYVHAAPLCLYALPRLWQGRRQAVLTGCAPRATLVKVCTDARALECDVVCTSNYTALVPPRVLFVADTDEGFRLLAEEHGLAWMPDPPAWTLAEWSADLGRWQGTLQWYEGTGPKPEALYRPGTFETNDEPPAQGNDFPVRLHQMTDTQTRRHQWYALVSRNADGMPQHAFVRDRSWGRWQAHTRAMRFLMDAAQFPEGEPIRIPYEPDSGRLILPRELILPYLLARSVFLCSGLVPQLVQDCRAFRNLPPNPMSPTGRYFAPRDTGYRGACWIYRCVPRPIAERVLAKVGAVPEDIVQGEGVQCDCVPTYVQ